MASNCDGGYHLASGNIEHYDTSIMQGYKAQLSTTGNGNGLWRSFHVNDMLRFTWSSVRPCWQRGKHSELLALHVQHINLIRPGVNILGTEHHGRPAGGRDE